MRYMRLAGFLFAVVLSICSIHQSASAAEKASIPGIPAEENDAKSDKVSEVLPVSVGISKKYGNVSNAAKNMSTVTKIGEKLTYLIKWNGIPAGEATLRVKRQAKIRGKEALVYELHTESNDFLSVFYEVNSTVKSFADIETGKSYLFRRKLHEGRYRANDRLQFDYDHLDENGEIAPASRYSKYEDGKDPVIKTPRPIPGPVQDSLSIIYYLRHLDFSDADKTQQILLGSRKRTDIVNFSVKKSQTLALSDIGKFDCVIVEPKGSGKSKNSGFVVTKSTANVWLEKNTKIPLMVSVDIPIGTATATLIKCENTDLDKYNLSK